MGYLVASNVLSSGKQPHKEKKPQQIFCKIKFSHRVSLMQIYFQC